MDRQLGTTGIYVFPIGLGAMPLSIQGRPAEREAIAVIHAALDAGVNFIDTADAYCYDDTDTGHNERLIAKALAEYGNSSEILVATKGGCIRPGGRWEVDGRPEHLRRACEKSLAALGVETITLYQFHAPDRRVAFEDSVGELKHLQDEGKIQHLGLSNVSVDELKCAQKIARIESVQNRFNPFEQRRRELELIKVCKDQEVTYIAHSPVGGHGTHREAARHPLLQKLAAKYQTSSYCIMLAWHLAKGEHLLPIPGASKVISAVDSPKAVNVKLEDADQSLVDELGG